MTSGIKPRNKPYTRMCKRCGKLFKTWGRYGRICKRCYKRKSRDGWMLGRKHGRKKMINHKAHSGWRQAG